MGNIIDGKGISNAIREELAERVKALAAKGVTPGLAVILVGEDPASQVYVRNKGRACEKLGIYSVIRRMPEATTEEELLRVIEELNADLRIDGILVQMPVPKQINPYTVQCAIDPDKDVDVFHPTSVGRLMNGHAELYPCTPAGVIELLERNDVKIDGASCVVLGRSQIVGRPLAVMLQQKNGTVTVCHTHTKNTAEICRNADIIVAAVGVPHFLTADMVKPGAVVIDVGINRMADGSLTGDADFDAILPIASAITPVPGGVGPMTITMLLKNTIRVAELRAEKQ